MPDANQEIARRVLEGVLRRLEGNAPVAPAANALTTSSASQDQPMIFIVLGNLELSPNGERSGDPRPIAAEAINITNNRTQPASSPTVVGNSQTAHPEFERFPLADAQATAPAPKACFMEPDRICVHSGACEMRGV